MSRAIESHVDIICSLKDPVTQLEFKVRHEIICIGKNDCLSRIHYFSPAFIGSHSKKNHLSHGELFDLIHCTKKKGWSCLRKEGDGRTWIDESSSARSLQTTRRRYAEYSLTAACTLFGRRVLSASDAVPVFAVLLLLLHHLRECSHREEKEACTQKGEEAKPIRVTRHEGPKGTQCVSSLRQIHSPAPAAPAEWVSMFSRFNRKS